MTERPDPYAPSGVWRGIESARYENYTAWIEFNYSHDRMYRYLSDLGTIPTNRSEWQSCYIDVRSE